MKRILVGLVLCGLMGCRTPNTLSTGTGTSTAEDRARIHAFIDNYIKDSKEKGVSRMTILTEFKYVNTYLLFLSISNDSLLVDHLAFRKGNTALVSQSRIELKPEDKDIIGSIFSDEFNQLSIPRTCYDGIDHHYFIEFTKINGDQRYDNLFESSCENYINERADKYQPLIKMFEYNESTLCRKRG